MLAVQPQFEAPTCSFDGQNSPIYTNMPVLSPPGDDSPYNRLLTVFQQLRYLTRQLSQTKFGKPHISANDMFGFSTARSCVERALLSLSLIHITTITDTPRSNKTKYSDTTLAFEALRLAALIFLNLVLRECSPYSPVMQSLKSQLLVMLQTAENPSASSRPQQRSAIWVFVMGGLLAMDDTEENWFAVRIRNVMQDMETQSWAEMEEVLNESLWADDLTRSVQRGLWRRVRSTEGELRSSLTKF